MQNLIYNLTEESQRDLFFLLTQNSKIAVLCFSAVWCGPCKKLQQDLYTKLNLVAGKEEDLSNLENLVVVVKVDIDVFGDLAELYEVKGIPHVVFLKNGELQTDVIVGCQTDRIVKKVAELNV